MKEMSTERKSIALDPNVTNWGRTENFVKYYKTHHRESAGKIPAQQFERNLKNKLTK